MNIVYLQPWNNPGLAENLHKITNSKRHAPVVVAAARLLKGSVPTAVTTISSNEAGETIPVSLEQE